MYSYVVFLFLPAAGGSSNLKAYHQCASNPSAARRLAMARFARSGGGLVLFCTVSLHNWGP